MLPRERKSVTRTAAPVTGDALRGGPQHGDDHVHVDRRAQTARRSKDVAEALKCEIGYSFPIDEATCVAAANQGVPLHKVNQRSPLVDAIANIAKAEVGEAPAQQAGRGIFGRLFSEARV